MVKAILVVALCYFLSPIAIAKIQNKVIYGDDNRQEFFQVRRSDVREVADSTAAVVRNSSLTPKSDGTTDIKAESFQKMVGLCSTERFASEPSGAFCSAFLVGDDMIATAGHCIDTARCPQSSFVFTYRMSEQGQAPNNVSSSEIYRCQAVLEREQTGAQDYALVKLDRPVRGHRILTLAKDPVAVGDTVVTIGHPSGIPTKITDNGVVRSTKPEFFTANLDTYGGNSGSAVFDQNTLQVVGILVRGESDFVYDRVNKCSVSNRCPADGCRGEDVTNISYISEALKKH
ncbi:MAG: trypsin-like peptidase domain-containing protein [Bdellovibrionales bacterium]|nr:trypsin-like peptidase domain-containing protein [Bdellovibrionales bacterium]